MSRHRAAGPSDAGFTLIEVLVSIAMISVVTSGLTMFFVQSRAAVQVQSQIQQAAQVASATLEKAGELPGASLVSGRPAWCVNDQWGTAANTVKSYFTGLTQLSDISLASSTWSTATCTSASQLGRETLPTQQASTITVNGQAATFTQNTYLGTCWQQVNSTSVSSGVCVAPAGTLTSSYVPMTRLVVAITWPSAKCPAGTCLYVSDALLAPPVADLTFQLP